MSRSAEIERARAAHFADDGPADPDRAWAWRDCGDGAEDAEDGPIDTDASFAAYRKVFSSPCPLLPSAEAAEQEPR